MKTPYIQKAGLIKILVLAILISSVIEILYSHYMVGVCSTFFTLSLIFVFYGSNRVARLFRVVFVKKSVCPYYIQSECPYGTIDQCPYDTTLCHNFKKKRVHDGLRLP